MVFSQILMAMFPQDIFTQVSTGLHRALITLSNNSSNM